MKYFIFSVVCLIASINFAQTFPDGWEGNYQGEMVIGHAEKSGDTVNVHFILKEIVKDSSWTYKLTFHSEKYGEIIKDYIIRKTGDVKSAYLLDEQDGIEIEMTLMDNCFYSSFEVMDHIYTTALYKMGNDLFFDLKVMSKTPTLITNSEIDEDGVSFEVKSYKPIQHQSVYLKRQ